MTTNPTSVPLNEATRLNIAEYTLGTLYGNEETRIRELINSNDEAVHQALHWETILLAMADRLPPASTEPLILARVQRTLGLPRIDPEIQPLSRPEKPSQDHVVPVEPTVKVQSDPRTDAGARTKPAASDDSLLSANHPEATHQDGNGTRRQGRQHPVLWVIGALILVALAFVLLRPKPTIDSLPAASQTEPEVTEPEVKPAEALFIAILQPPKSTSTPGWVLLQSNPGQLRAEPRLQSQRAPDQGLALWLREADSPDTRFLGWVSDITTNDIKLPDGLALTDNTLFEITLERTDIDTTRPPDGSVLFIGQAIKAMLPDDQAQTAAPSAQPR